MSIADKLTAIAENEQRVYDAGFTAGQNSGGGGGYEEGYADGKQAEHDSFWDVYQQNGTATDYNSAFVGMYWDFDNFFPKYDIVPTNGTKMLYAWSYRAASIGNLTDRLNDCGVVIDTSNATTLLQAFAYSRFTEIPSLDLSSCSANGLQQTFYYADRMITLGKLKVNESLTYNNTFGNCNQLQNVEFDGTIGQSIDFLWCPLSAESVQNIIDHLKDLTGTTAKTLTLKADVGAKLTEAQKATITAKNWALVY